MSLGREGIVQHMQAGCVLVKSIKQLKRPFFLQSVVQTVYVDARVVNSIISDNLVKVSKEDENYIEYILNEENN